MVVSIRKEILRGVALLAVTAFVLASAASAAGKDKRSGYNKADIKLPGSAKKVILKKTDAKKIVDLHELVFRKTQHADYLAVKVTLEIEWGWESWYHITLILEKPVDESGWRNAEIYTSSLDIAELFNRPYDEFKYSLDPYDLNASQEAPVPPAGEPGACATLHEKPIAIFIDPTDEELEAMKKANSEEDFFTITDDNLYYNAQAIEFLKQRDIPYCFTTEEGHEFVTPDNKTYSVNKECSHWCLIIWNGKAEPLSVIAIDLFMYESYFKGEE
jgi:hypothetical protein